MATGTPFSPTPFATSVVAASATSIVRRAPYISPSEYRFAPTAVATTDLVPGSTNQATDSLNSLAQVINRASSWIDTYCFHTGDGTLAASPSTEQGWIVPRANGSLGIVANYKPILEVLGVAVGPTPSSLTNLDSSISPDIWIENKIIWIPNSWASSGQPSFPTFFTPTFNGGVYAVWSYVNGYPHTYLQADATAGASTLVVGPSTPDGTGVSGIYPNTQLTIHDGSNTEVVVVSSVGSYASGGVTLNLVSPLQYAHSVPTAPDTIRVSALPWAVEQAAILITSCLIKTRGSRGMVMPTSPGQQPNQRALAQAGALEDFTSATDLLKPFVTTFLAR